MPCQNGRKQSSLLYITLVLMHEMKLRIGNTRTAYTVNASYGASKAPKYLSAPSNRLGVPNVQCHTVRTVKRRVPLSKYCKIL